MADSRVTRNADQRGPCFGEWPGSRRVFRPIVAPVLVGLLAACGAANYSDSDDSSEPSISQSETPSDHLQSQTSAAPLTTSSTPAPRTDPPSDAEPELPAGAVPPELVGAWCGGPDARHATWIFEPDGAFIATERVPLSGVAQVDGGVIILFTNEVGPQERTIAMDKDTLIGDVLYLEDYSYVRGEC